MNSIVLGAGVVGLSTALLLQQRGHRVTIVAKGNPLPKFYDSDPHYVSREAGAHWCSFAEEDDTRMQQLEAITLRALYQLCQYPETGVKQMRNACLYKRRPVDFRRPWFASLAAEFRMLEPTELPHGFEFGYSYQTVTINVPKYLRWMLEQFQLGGGQLVVKSLTDIGEVMTNNVDLVVNCTGYGARYLGGVGDRAVYPCRGQTLLVKVDTSQPALETLTRQGDNEGGGATYIIPRDDGTAILGGTFEVNNANLDPHPKTAKAILDRCCAVSPALARARQEGKLKVLRNGVGLRPYRAGGLRLEREKRGMITIIHNYGHGGWGFQTSWGCAQAVCDILQQSSQNNSSKL